MKSCGILLLLGELLCIIILRYICEINFYFVSLFLCCLNAVLMLLVDALNTAVSHCYGTTPDGTELTSKITCPIGSGGCLVIKFKKKIINNS